MKNAALIAKVLARRAKLAISPLSQTISSEKDLIHFLSKKSEKKFVTDFVNGLESKDLQCYLALWRSMGTLNEIDRQAMQRIIGTEIDLQNILWVYRLKHFYEIFGDEAYGFLIPIRYRLSGDAFATIVACKDIAQLQATIQYTIYKDVFRDFNQPEQRLALAVKVRYRTESRRSHIALLCGYLYEFMRCTNDYKNEIHKHIRAHGQHEPRNKPLSFPL